MDKDRGLGKGTYASPRSSKPIPMYALRPPSPSTRRTKYLEESSTGSTALFVGVYRVKANNSPESERQSLNFPCVVRYEPVFASCPTIHQISPFIRRERKRPTSNRISHLSPISKTLTRPFHRNP